MKKKLLLGALLVIGGISTTNIYAADSAEGEKESVTASEGQVAYAEGDFGSETGVKNIIEELDTLENIGVVESSDTVAPSQWSVSARTYIEREDYSRGDFGQSENIFMFGTGVNAVKDRWGLHLNVEQRLTGHLNTEGADNQNTRVDYKVRYQATDEMGVHFKYRSERGRKKRDAWAAEQDRNRDRFELGTDFNFFDGYWSGWLVGGHDIDSSNGAKNKGQYYEGDMGPTFQINEKLSLRPTVYSTGEFYDNNNEEMLEHQIRLMAIYKHSDKLTLMPRVRYTLSRELEEDSYTYRYESDYRIRAEFLFDYKINDQFSVDGGIAYDWQDRDYERKDGNGEKFDETLNIDMIWYYLALNYRF